MIMFLIGIVLFLLEIWVLKNTTVKQRGQETPLQIRLWWVMLLVLGNIGPMCFFTVAVFFFVWSNQTYWVLHGPQVTKILNFLNKEVWK